MKKISLLFVFNFLIVTLFSQAFGPIIINVGNQGSEPKDFKILNNLLIFTASDSQSYYPRKVFRSDGTTLGTFALNNNISVQSNNYNDNNYNYNDININDSAFVKLGNYLYFCGVQNGNGSLWRTDGTINGTTQVNSYSPGQMVVLNQKLFFLTTYLDPTWGTQTTRLIKYEPLTNTTSEIYNWNNSLLLTGTSPLRVYNNKMFFYGWESDGTSGNTIQNNLNLPAISESCIFNNFIYYRGDNGNLWRTNGTTNGTFQAINFPVFGGIIVYNNLMYFSGGNVGAGMQGTELCSSDGTISNTNVLKDIYFGYQSSYPSDFSIINGSLYFLARDQTYGNEIYKTDGTSNGTFLFYDFEVGNISTFWSNFKPTERYNSKIEHQNKLFFNINPYIGTTRGIWESNGTVNNASQVFQIDTSRSLIDVNGKLFFAGFTESEGWELYAEGLTNSINENLINSLIAISPNPTKDLITLKSDKIFNKQIKILDQFGRIMVKSKFESTETQIDLRELSSGIYFLQMEGQNNLQKIIKE